MKNNLEKTTIELTIQQLKQLRLIELDIMDEIDRICKNNNIKYSLSGGTLLGAVRHGGFIPWDDDIDIMMMRNDYDRFCRIASESDSSHFCLVNAYNDKYFGHTFSKMMAKDTFMEEMVTSSTQTPKGVFVDIFPIDYANSSEKRNIDSFKKMRRISRNLLCRGNYYFGQSGIRLLLYRINGVLLRLIPKSFFLEKMDAIVENRDPNPKVLSLSGTYNYEKEIHDTSIFNEYQYIAFEDRKYMAIKQADMFLTDAYGDYMKLPPKEKQIPHHFVVGIDLEQYWRK